MKPNKAFTLFARITLVCLTLFVVGAALSTGSSGVDVVGVLTMAAAPFAFVLPDALKSQMTKEEQEGIKALGDQISTYLQAQENGQLDQKSLNDKVKEAWDDHAKLFGMDKDTIKSLQDTLKQQGIEMTALKEGKRGGERYKSLDEQIGEWVKSQDYKNSLQSKTPTTLNVKAASPFSVRPSTIGGAATTDVFASAPELFRIDVDRTIHSAERDEPFLFDLLWKGGTDSTLIVWFNRINKQGGAAITPEYGVKPLMSWNYERKTTEPQKVTVSVKMSTEMMNDASFVTGEVRSVLKEDLWDKIDDNVFDYVEGIASSYLGTGLDNKIPTPNNADAIRAMVLQLRNLSHKADLLILSPTDKAHIDLTKNGTGNYMKQEIDAILKNLRIKESLELAEGTFMLMDTSKVKTKTKGGISISTGWGVNQVATTGTNQYKSDFEMNAVTLLVEQEIYIYHDTINETAIALGDFADIKEALLLNGTTL